VNRAERRALRGGELLDELDWWTFVCVGCGETVWIGHDPDQDLAELALMCRQAFGEPPVCSACQADLRHGR